MHSTAPLVIRIVLMLSCMHAQAQKEHWRLLAEERAATINVLGAELQHAQVTARDLVRVCIVQIIHSFSTKARQLPND
jgi:hypothetical protein